MISTVLGRSVLGASRRTRTLPVSLTSINAALFHHLTPSATTAANVKPSVAFGIKARDFHIQSGPSEFRASMVSPAAQNYAPSYESSDGGDSESVGSSGAISELGISPEIVKALSGRGIDKLFPIQKAVLEPAMQGRSGGSSNRYSGGSDRFSGYGGFGIRSEPSMVAPVGIAFQGYSTASRSSVGGSRDSKIKMSPGNVKKKKGGGGGEESTSKIKGTRICIAIRSFDNPEKQAWCLPPHTRYAAMPDTRTLYTVLRSPHVDKKSREQFEMRFKKRFLVIKAQSHELSKKLFWLKRYRILGAQYELQFHCKTRLDMAPVLGNINGSVC